MSDDVAAFLGPGVSVDEQSFTDLTDVPVKRLGFVNDGRLAVKFDGDLPTEIRAAIRRRMEGTSLAAETLLATLADTATPPEPTLAERVTTLEARVDMLTKIVLGDTDQETP
jgi:hypothetical protein